MPKLVMETGFPQPLLIFFADARALFSVELSIFVCVVLFDDFLAQCLLLGG